VFLKKIRRVLGHAKGMHKTPSLSAKQWQETHCVAGSFSFFIAQRCVAKESYFLHRARPMRKKGK